MNQHRLHQAPYWGCLRSARLLWLALPGDVLGVEHWAGGTTT